MKKTAARAWYRITILSSYLLILSRMLKLGLGIYIRALFETRMNFSLVNAIVFKHTLLDEDGKLKPQFESDLTDSLRLMLWLDGRITREALGHSRATSRIIKYFSLEGIRNNSICRRAVLRITDPELPPISLDANLSPNAVCRALHMEVPIDHGYFYRASIVKRILDCGLVPPIQFDAEADLNYTRTILKNDKESYKYIKEATVDIKALNIFISLALYPPLKLMVDCPEAIVTWCSKAPNFEGPVRGLMIGDIGTSAFAKKISDAHGYLEKSIPDKVFNAARDDFFRLGIFEPESIVKSLQSATIFPGLWSSSEFIPSAEIVTRMLLSGDKKQIDEGLEILRSFKHINVPNTGIKKVDAYIKANSYEGFASLIAEPEKPENIEILRIYLNEIEPGRVVCRSAPEMKKTIIALEYLQGDFVFPDGLHKASAKTLFDRVIFKHCPYAGYLIAHAVEDDLLGDAKTEAQFCLVYELCRNKSSSNLSRYPGFIRDKQLSSDLGL